MLYSDCQDAFEQGEEDDTKLYNIRPKPSGKGNFFKVRCIFDGSNGWTMVLNRGNGSVDFSKNRPNGGGNIDGEFWTGKRGLTLSLRRQTIVDTLV